MLGGGASTELSFTGTGGSSCVIEHGVDIARNVPAVAILVALRLEPALEGCGEVEPAAVERGRIERRTLEHTSQIGVQQVSDRLVEPVLERGGSSVAGHGSLVDRALQKLDDFTDETTRCVGHGLPFVSGVFAVVLFRLSARQDARVITGRFLGTACMLRNQPVFGNEHRTIPSL
jgi:hypothetical protein